MDAEVLGDASSQFYNVRSPSGATILQRRRSTVTLGIGGYDLLDSLAADPQAPNLLFRARVRYDADYGASAASADPTRPNDIVPGFAQGVVDLMYAYIEGSRLVGGWFGFKLGRQYIVDALGWWAFDGAETSATTPFFLKAKAYVGVEERGGMPLGTPRFESNGIWRGDRGGFDRALYPSFQAASLAPAFGGAIESSGLSWLHGMLTYRRVHNTGAAEVAEFSTGSSAPPASGGWRVSSERLGCAIDGTWRDIGGAKAGAVYDLSRAGVTQIYGSVDGYVGKRVTLSADYDYFVPWFEGDSIWNFFAVEPTSDVGLRANVDLDPHLGIVGGVHLRIFDVAPAPSGVGNSRLAWATAAISGDASPSNGHAFDRGGNVSARWRTGDAAVAFRGSGNFGDEGDRAGADLSGERTFDGRYSVGGRTGVWQWTDKLRPDRSVAGYSYVATIGYRFAPRAQARVEWEHDMNRLAGQRFRLTFLLTLAATK